MVESRIFQVPFADIYPHYVTKVTRKHRTEGELQQVLAWLTGYNEDALREAIDDGRSMREFFAQAPAMNPSAGLITGSICGVRVEEVADPLMQQIRWMDKIVDELAKGKDLGVICREPA